MLTLLEPAQYSLALPLFGEMNDQLAVFAVLNGESHGEVFVDDPHHPGSALLRVSYRYYLAGSTTNAAFNQDVRCLFAETIIPARKAAGDGGFLVFDDMMDWGLVIEETLLKGYKLYPGPRQSYELNLEQPAHPVPPAADLPAGLSLQTVDRTLMERKELANLHDLAEELCSERSSVDEFLQKSFGTVILSDTRLAAWCLSEYNLDDRCEVGIATMADYQRMGLATAAGLAFIAQAQAHGIHRIGWHCWTRNEASVATARRLGFTLIKDLRAYFVALREE